MNYRLYCFVNNVYMSPIQWGIQTAHVVSSVSVKYEKRSKQHKAYESWAKECPTLMVMQGGNVAMLHDKLENIDRLANDLGLAWAPFFEDEDSLGGILTSVGVLVPEDVFTCTIEWLRGEDGVKTLEVRTAEDDVVRPGSSKYEFVHLIKSARLAGM